MPFLFIEPGTLKPCRPLNLPVFITGMHLLHQLIRLTVLCVKIIRQSSTVSVRNAFSNQLKAVFCLNTVHSNPISCFI
jgi:hypothetical protein